MATISVVLAAQRTSIRSACRDLLEAAADIQITGEATSGGELVRLAGSRPHVVLVDLDLCLRYRDGLLRMIREVSPQSKILLLTARSSTSHVVDALAQGARGYLGRHDFKPFLIKAVRALDAGEAWVPRRLVGRLLTRLVRLEVLAKRRR